MLCYNTHFIVSIYHRHRRVRDDKRQGAQKVIKIKIKRPRGYHKNKQLSLKCIFDMHLQTCVCSSFIKLEIKLASINIDGWFNAGLLQMFFII
jgi:hypothetical protein